ncbi:MAG: SGNH/GDSL hydrolase family protein [Ruminococcaceae bacterium]|nr:SGNH/GDSL hydrolase family protein [Oscillospiraceae bacterium]
MKLSFDKIKEIATGAVCAAEENGYVYLHRFTDGQRALYFETNKDFYAKALTAAGIKLSFKTDSTSLTLKGIVELGLSRRYYSFDVFVNGEVIGYIDNFSMRELPKFYVDEYFELPQIFEKTFELGEGEKTVCVHLPWSVIVKLEEISLDDGTYVLPVKPVKKLLAYGDSITHGYDALRPSNRYIARLADKLGAEEINKAIGGEMFFDKLAELKDGFIPDYITVAYGTNDWSMSDIDSFRNHCRAFYTKLSENYPTSKIFAITPIWRREMSEYRVFGKFDQVEEEIRNIVNGIDNITLVRGFDFVPKDENFFADSRLHPNDDGFGNYFENLYKHIKKNL